MKISLVVPSRNNLRYFKWMYESVRKNQGEHEVFICAAADACTDGTEEYFKDLSENDPYFRYIVNSGPKRLGHTILYDQIVRDLVETDLAMIWHSDMYLCPGALDAIEKNMYELTSYAHDNSITQLDPIKKRIVSLTRIEPPLHPDGPEKILMDFGTEPEDFDEGGLLETIGDINNENSLRKNVAGLPFSKTTEGIFAPWAFWVDEFKEIGGHDPLYAPQSKEDSDIFNRFHLNGIEFIQTWEGFVYHMTCRGSRRNTHDGAPDITTDNPEWLAQNWRSTKNFIRKWGSMVKHDEYLKPIVPHKFDIGVVYLGDYDERVLGRLEVFASCIYVDRYKNEFAFLNYIESEENETDFFICDRVKHYDFADGEIPNHDVVIYLDAVRHETIEYLMHFGEILTKSLDITGDFNGEEFTLAGDFKVKINTNSLRTLEKNLINCERKTGYFN